ncbi:hypothetical protein [Enterovirga sp. CN4-39]|uniref:hypothetical protein n=1 Tax=Enterovirga sp. CN4-39 TaxID=3400910 RepID=UPI003C05C011
MIVPGEKYPQKTLPDLVAALERAGSATNFGSSGVGSPTHHLPTTLCQTLLPFRKTVEYRT